MDTFNNKVKPDEKKNNNKPANIPSKKINELAINSTFFITNGDFLSKAISLTTDLEKPASNILAYPINAKISVITPNNSIPNCRARTPKTGIAIRVGIITANIFQILFLRSGIFAQFCE